MSRLTPGSGPDDFAAAQDRLPNPATNTPLATERELAMLADLKACAEVIGEGTVFGLTLSRNIAAYERESLSEEDDHAVT